MVAKNKEKEMVANEDELRAVSQKNIFKGVFQGLSFFDKLSFATLSILLFLLPFFSLEFIGINLDASKLLVFSVLATTSIVSFIFARIKDRRIFFPQKSIFLVFFAFLLVIFISAFFSSSYTLSFLGYSFEFGTVVSFLYALFLLWISSYYIRNTRTISFILCISAVSFLVVVLFSLIKILLPLNYIMGVPLGSNTMSLVGTWGDYGVYVSIFSLIFILVFEVFNFNKFFKISIGFLIFISLVSLVSVNSIFPWIFLGIGSFIIFVAKLLFLMKDKKRLPIISFVSIIISLLFIFSSVSSYISEKINTNYTEIRPSIASSIHVISGTFSSNLLTGFGPNNFSVGWNVLRSPDVINTDFWDTPFIHSIGSIPTLFVTTGYIGGILFVLFFVLLLSKLIKATYKSYGNDIKFRWLLVLISINLILFLSYLFSIVGLVVFVYSFVVFGISLSFISSNIRLEKDALYFKKNFNSILFVSISVVFLILFPVILERAIIRVISMYSFDRGSMVTGSDDENIFLRELYLKRAYNIFPNDFYARSLAQISYEKLNNTLKNSISIKDSVRPELQSMVSLIEKYAIASASFNKENAYGWQYLGEMYYKLYSLGIDNTFDNTLSAFNKTMKFNPLSPVPYFYIGLIYMDEGRYDEAEKSFKQSLDKKIDYEDAVFGLIELYKKTNRQEEAYNYAKSVESYFSNSYTFFLNLGILEYDMAKYKEALVSLSRSILLAGENENTRYYLALTYDALGRDADALLILEDLLKKYPESENLKIEISKIQNKTIDKSNQIDKN